MNGAEVTGVYKQGRYGKVQLYQITTVYIERHNFVRPHRGLKPRGSNQKPRQQKWIRRTPALAAGLTDHVWSLKEFMSKKIFINY